MQNMSSQEMADVLLDETALPGDKKKNKKKRGKQAGNQES